MNYVIEKLNLGWSPDQIAGRICHDIPGQSISHEAIYQFIYERETLRHMDLSSCLPRRYRKRLQHGYSPKHRKTHIPERIPIEDRLPWVNERRDPGHWELDTLVSRPSAPSFGIALEPLSCQVHMAKLAAKTPGELRLALNRSLGRHRDHMRQTISYDNGSENVAHILLNKTLGTQPYFCEPYGSWEKGSVEHSIGLIRCFLRKKTDFATITTSD